MGAAKRIKIDGEKEEDVMLDLAKDNAPCIKDEAIVILTREWEASGLTPEVIQAKLAAAWEENQDAIMDAAGDAVD